LGAATGAHLSQFAPAPFRLAAVLAVPLDGPLKGGFGPVDSALAAVMPVRRCLGLNGHKAA
jgi:hypothetical protein